MTAPPGEAKLLPESGVFCNGVVKGDKKRLEFGDSISDSELLVTKLFPPVSAGRLLARPRLLERCRSEAFGKLIVIHAPAGSGKTSLMAQFHAELTLSDKALAVWISLDENERDARSFLLYLLSACMRAGVPVEDQLIAVLGSSAEVNLLDFVVPLVNRIADVGRPVVIFLDDYHRAESPDVGEAVQGLLTLAPADFRLFLASRTVPDLPLGNLRVQVGVLELGGQDLKFDINEAGEFLANARGIDLSDEQVRELHSRTEGWVAGLQLAALSIDTTDSADGLIGAFLGSEREVADYLATEVLARQPEKLRDFLLDTAVLERMNAEVCNLITGRADSQDALEQIEDRGLFLVPLDKHGAWYRYHHMFRDFLLSELRHNDAARLQRLNKLAGGWFAGRGLATEALGYFLKAESYDEAAVVVEEHAHRLMFMGRMPDLAAWVGRIPAHISARRPRLPIYHCWALFHMRRNADAAAALNRAETVVDTMEATGYMTDEVKLLTLREELEVLRTGIAIVADDQETCFELSEQLLANSRTLKKFSLGALLNIHGYACYALSDLDRARTHLYRARDVHADAGSTFGTVYADVFTAMTEIVSCKFHKAHEILQRAEREGQAAQRGPSVLVAAPNVVLAQILYEWNRCEEAEALLSGNLEFLRDCGHPDGPAMGYLTLSRIKFARGDKEGGNRAILDLLAMGQSSGLDRLVLLAEHDRLWQHLARGRLDDAMELVHGMGIGMDDEMESRPGRWDRMAYLRDLMRARMLIALGEEQAAIGILDRLGKLAADCGRLLRVVQLNVLSAVAASSAGDGTAARTAMAEAINLAHKESMVRSFVDEGSVIRDILQSMLDHDGGPEVLSGELLLHLKKLLGAFDADLSKHMPVCKPLAARGGPPEYELVEPLSRREGEVLALLAAGRANRAIASELRISENTVKWHVKNIFEKLSVSNRTAAVLAAQGLGLIK